MGVHFHSEAHLFASIFDPDSNTDPDDDRLLLAKISCINGSPERQSLPGSHGQRPWIYLALTQSIPDSFHIDGHGWLGLEWSIPFGDATDPCP
jgi:hypothetical protein